MNTSHNTRNIQNVNILEPHLPSDPDAELTVIEGCLAPGGLEKALKLLNLEDFSTVGGRKIFKALEALHRTGRPISITVLERSLESDPDFSRILTALDQMVPFTAESVTHFAKIVRELSIRRRLMFLAATVVEDLGDVSMSIPEAAGNFIDEYQKSGRFLKSLREERHVLT